MNRLKHFVWLAALLAGVAIAPPAFAQDKTGTDDASKTSDQAPADDSADVDSAIDSAIDSPNAPAATPAKPAAKPAASASAKKSKKEAKKPAKEKDPLAGMKPSDKMYWATVRGIYTMQRRKFRKSGRVGVTVYGGLIPNNIFEQYYPVGLRIDYFFLENLGLELAGSYAFKTETRLQNLIREKGGVGAGQVLIGDTQRSHTNFGVVWSPFYGKLAFYNDALIHFDLFLFAGVGLVIAETTTNFIEKPTQDFKAEGALGGGLAMFFGRHFALRADYRQFAFQKVTGGVANPSEVSLGVSYFF